MIGGRKPITVSVHASLGTVHSDIAISFGLITTELVINALKHAFPGDQSGKIIVTYDKNKTGWSLSIHDNGIGQSNKQQAGLRGLGTSIIGAIANQLQAVVQTESSPQGTKVSVVHLDVV